jgi:hypothetical protein
VRGGGRREPPRRLRTEFSDSNREGAVWVYLWKYYILYNNVRAQKGRSAAGPVGRLSPRAGRVPAGAARLPGAAQSHMIYILLYIYIYIILGYTIRRGRTMYIHTYMLCVTIARAIASTYVGTSTWGISHGSIIIYLYIYTYTCSSSTRIYFFPIIRIPPLQIVLRPSREVLHLWTGRITYTRSSPIPGPRVCQIIIYIYLYIVKT